MRKSSRKAAIVSPVLETAAASTALAIIETVAPVETAAETAALETVTDATIGALVIDNDTGANVEPEAPVATPDPRVARAERIAADRTAVHALYAAFEANRSSVPVKALSAFKLATSTCHPVSRGASARQAAALAVGLAANGKKLADGVSFKRVFEINGVNSAIENGVLRDAISSGLITVSGATPEAELITIAKKASATIRGLLGATVCKAGNL